MAQIVYICPFGTNEITGGIKNAYRNVEVLNELGFDAYVYQPAGRPEWFESSAPLFPGDISQLGLSRDDVLVYPEIIHSEIEYLLSAGRPARNILFCRNQYYAVGRLQDFMEKYKSADPFDHVVTCAEIPKQFLERVFKFKEVKVVHNYIDGDIFRPLPKQAQIAVFGRKLPFSSSFINNAFYKKNPALRHMRWVPILDRSEAETAQILGESTVALTLCHWEAFASSPLEAMAAGALVVGFHGYGGLEYATEANGVWMRPDFLEETADALAAALIGIESGDPRYTEMQRAAFETAQRFSRESNRNALLAFYSPLFQGRE